MEGWSHVFLLSRAFQPASIWKKEQDLFALLCVYSQLLLLSKDLLSPPLSNMFVTTFQFLSALPNHLETYPFPAQFFAPPIVELSLFPLWLSHPRLSHFFQPQSTCTSHHTIFCTKFTCPALVPFKISNWLSALNTLKNKIRKPNQTQTN